MGFNLGFKGLILSTNCARCWKVNDYYTVTSCTRCCQEFLQASTVMQQC